jgi:glutamate N-acetyltransferase/amino-acid N-acetyltransferase
MESRLEPIEGGTVTSPAGFHAGAVAAEIKKGHGDKLDLGILFSQEPCVTAGLLTTSAVKSAPVVLCRQRLKRGRATAVVANSGCANASTGEQGLADAEEMAVLAAEALGCEADDILVASTGVIGEMLPMERIKEGIGGISLSNQGGHEFARAIMTTDTVPKEIALIAEAGGSRFTIGGVAKGSGMIHPDLGTMLSFLTTDAAVEPAFLKAALRRAADVSFNMVSIDGDTSPSDTLLIMANGLAGNQPLSEGSQAAAVFQQALDRVCIHLARAIARDGEGASKLIEVTVNGAASRAQAALAARTVVSSPLLKAAVYGCNPNWGRVVAALGRSGAEVVEGRLEISIGGVPVLRDGVPQAFDRSGVIQALKRDEVRIVADLHLGTASATAWGCDLTEEYVVINSRYTT